MEDEAALFWENVKKEIKRQNTTQDWVAKKAGISFNTFQGWIAKGIYPRLNEGARIASSLNTSIEYLVSGSVRNNAEALGLVRFHLERIKEYLGIIEDQLKCLE